MNDNVMESFEWRNKMIRESFYLICFCLVSIFGLIMFFTVTVIDVVVGEVLRGRIYKPRTSRDGE